MSKYKKLFSEAKDIMEQRIEPDKDKREQKELENFMMSRKGKVAAEKIFQMYEELLVTDPLEYFLYCMSTSTPPFKNHYKKYSFFEPTSKLFVDNDVFKNAFIRALSTLIKNKLAEEVASVYFDFSIEIDCSIVPAKLRNTNDYPNQDEVIVKVSANMELCH